jgi:hypothetical protein
MRDFSDYLKEQRNIEHPDEDLSLGPVPDDFKPHTGRVSSLGMGGAYDEPQPAPQWKVTPSPKPTPDPTPEPEAQLQEPETPQEPKKSDGDLVDSIENAPAGQKQEALRAALESKIGKSIDDAELGLYYKAYMWYKTQPDYDPKTILNDLASQQDNLGIISDMLGDWTLNDDIEQYREMLRNQDIKNYTPHARRTYVDKLPEEYRVDYYKSLMNEIKS